MGQIYCKSPLNYVGGKFKLLPQLLSIFPSNIGTFVEPFCGGYNVGVNVNAKRYIAIDINSYLIDMFNYFKDSEACVLIAKVNEIIGTYHLSKENTEGYNQLRDDYNHNPNALMLFVLTCYSFNHQIRFNNNFKFNTPFGKNRSSYNVKIESNLKDFVEIIHNQNVDFLCSNFMDFDYSSLGSNDFVYCDPPYLITTGSYNDGKRGFGDWKDKEEKELLKILDELNERGVKFALSNVFKHMGRENDTLIQWAQKYKVNFINNDFNNSNYHSKAKDFLTIEVVITNY